MPKQTEPSLLPFTRVSIKMLDNPPLQQICKDYTELYKALVYHSMEKYLVHIAFMNPSPLEKRLTFQPFDVEFVQNFPSLLKKIYEDNPSLLASFLTYIVRRIKEISPLLKCDLEQFIKELEVLGLTWDGKEFLASVGTPRIDYKIRTRIEQILQELGEGYLEKYQGAMSTLTSNKPDNVSQGLSSMRDLMNSVLHKLTENDLFEDDEKVDGKPTRKARLKHILRKTYQSIGVEIELADSLSEVTDNIYRVLSKNVHSLEKKDFDIFLYAFKESEYLLYFLLSATK